MSGKDTWRDNSGELECGNQDYAVMAVTLDTITCCSLSHSLSGYSASSARGSLVEAKAKS